MLARARRKEPFFQALSPEVVASIRNYVYHREYEPRQIVYFPDDRVKYGRRGAWAVALAPTAVCLMWAEDFTTPEDVQCLIAIQVKSPRMKSTEYYGKRVIHSEGQ